MPDFMYIYDLSLNTKLNTRLLSSGIDHLRKLTTAIQACEQSDGALLKLQAKLKKYQDKSHTNSPTLAEQEEAFRIAQVIRYMNEPTKSATQLAADLARKGYQIALEAPVKEGNKLAAKQAAEAFMVGLTLPQQLLVNESQGLANPTTRYLSTYLSFSGSAFKANQNHLPVSQVVFFKTEKSEVGINRRDEFYTFNDLTNDNAESAVFYYKIVGKSVQSAVLSQAPNLHRAIQQALAQQALDKNGYITVSYQDDTENKPKSFQIEPIISVANEIQLGKDIKSLSWKTTVITHDNKVQLKDNIFDRYKQALQPKSTSNTVKPVKPVKSVKKIENIPEVIAAAPNNSIDMGSLMFIGACALIGVAIGFVTSGFILAIVLGIVGVSLGVKITEISSSITDKLSIYNIKNSINNFLKNKKEKKPSPAEIAEARKEVKVLLKQADDLENKLDDLNERARVFQKPIIVSSKLCNITNHEDNNYKIQEKNEKLNNIKKSQNQKSKKQI